jgi:hypothetical protein
MKRITWISILVFFTILAPWSRAAEQLVPISDKPLDSDCTIETLNGDYGISISGTRPAPPPLSGIPNYVPGTIEQVIGVGVRTFDGQGGFAQTTNEKGALSGILVPNLSASGTYTVNSDCSGTLTLHIPNLPFPVVYDFVITDRAREFLAIVASPQLVMVTNAGHRRR